MTTPYKRCSRDDEADCTKCSRPLAGDNDTGICYRCSQIDGNAEIVKDEVEVSNHGLHIMQAKRSS